MATASSDMPDFLEDYDAFLRDLKARIQSTQIKAVLSVNREMILLYWEIGGQIIERQEHASWGSALLDRLSQDLQSSFPGIAGFSRRNLYRMRALYLAYRDTPEIVPQLVAQIPWGHNVVLLEKVKDPDQRTWYIQQTIENGWSRAILVHQIETDLYGRQVAAAKTTTR
jgi:predicted nuclease of restriction endonuclease-like (RecB) superfamily